MEARGILTKAGRPPRPDRRKRLESKKKSRHRHRRVRTTTQQYDRPYDEKFKRVAGLTSRINQIKHRDHQERSAPKVRLGNGQR